MPPGFDWQNSVSLAHGPQGKLWVAGYEGDPGALRQTTYPFLWQFNQDSSPRFTRQWIGEGRGVDEMNITTVFGMDVNRYGVAVLTGSSHGNSGEWIEHEVVITETNWELQHDSFSTSVDDIGPKRELPVTEVADVGMVDPEVDTKKKTYIMLYRP